MPDKGDGHPRFIGHGHMCYKYPMKIIDSPISLGELKVMAEGRFGNLVKAVVDVERRIIAVDGELHADEEGLLLENGSRQEDLWGINIYPDLDGPERIEFDSFINIRPSRGNRSRGVDDPAVRDKVIQTVMGLTK
jgi:hypothetical protein